MIEVVTFDFGHDGDVNFRQNKSYNSKSIMCKK